MQKVYFPIALMQEMEPPRPRSSDFHAGGVAASSGPVDHGEHLGPVGAASVTARGGELEPSHRHHAHTLLAAPLAFTYGSVTLAGDIDVELAAGHSKKCTNVIPVQISPKKLLVCPGFPVESGTLSEKRCACVCGC